MFPTPLEVLGRYFVHSGCWRPHLTCTINFVFDIQVNPISSRLHIFLLSPMTSASLNLTWPTTPVSSLPFSCSVTPSVLSGIKKVFHYCLAGHRMGKKMQIWVTLNLCMRIYNWRESREMVFLSLFPEKR